MWVEELVCMKHEEYFRVTIGRNETPIYLHTTFHRKDLGTGREFQIILILCSVHTLMIFIAA